MSEGNAAVEVWKDVPGFEGRYWVSDQGNVRCAAKQLKLSLTWKGYQRVGLWKDRKAVGRSVHSLVLEAFVGPRPAGHHCAHADGNRQNNRLANLDYKTPKQNEADKRTHGTATLGDRHHQAKITEKQALEIKFSTRPNRELSRKFGLCMVSIQDLRAGRTWAHLPSTHPAPPAALQSQDIRS